MSVNCLWLLLSSCCCICVDAHMLLLWEREREHLIVCVPAHFLGIGQWILKIHTPQLTPYLWAQVPWPHTALKCVWMCTCVLMSVDVYYTCTCMYRKMLNLSSRCAQHVWCILCFAHFCVLCVFSWHVCVWLIRGTIQSWPLTQASSAQYPPTGCQCLKWRGCDITVLDTQWPLCACTASQMPAYPCGCQAIGRHMWEIMLPGSSVSPYDIRKWYPVCLCCRTYTV